MIRKEDREQDDQLRILLLDLSRRYGGASARALSLAKHLSPWHVAIAGLEGSPVIKLAREKNLPAWVVGISRLDPFIPFRLRRIIQQEGYQILDSQNIQSKFWGSMAAWLTRVGFVATLNSSYREEQGRSLKGKLYSMLDRWTNFKTDRFIAVSDPIRQDLLNAGIAESKVDLVVNAIEVEDTRSSTDPILLRRQIGIPDDDLVCINVGRLVWAKGQDDLINAFTTIAGSYPKVHLVILGEGVLHSALSDQIKAAGMEKRIHLPGFCEPESVFAWLKASHLFILTSRSEGLSLALLEAASLGLPILSTRCGGIPDLFTDNKDAILVEIGDTSAIASGIGRLINDQQYAHKLGSNARDLIEVNHGMEKQVVAIRKIYMDTIRKKSNR